MRKAATKEEKAHIMRVKCMKCVACQEDWFDSQGYYWGGTVNTSDYHHITDGGRRLGHMWGLPLCEKCHRGEDGFSGKNRGAWDKSLENQLRLMAKVYKLIGKEPPAFESKLSARNKIITAMRKDGE